MSGHGDESGDRGFYLTRLRLVLGWKGAAILIALLGATALASARPGYAAWGPLALALAATLAVGLVATRELPTSPGRGDPVGATMAVAAATIGATRLTALPEPWWLYGATAALVLVAVLADYWWSGRVAAGDGWRKRDLGRSEILKVDLPGLVTVETLLIYAILVGAGRADFAGSPYFGGIVFYFAASFFAIAAGYSEIARERTREERDYELHEYLLEMLIDLQGVEDATLRSDLARNLRTVADRLEGATVPSILNDDDGPVPLVLPTSDPVKLYQGSSLAGLAEALATEDLTGYAVTDDGDVFLARNGALVKAHVHGTWTNDPTDADVAPRRALLYATSHGLLNLVDTVTPPDYATDDVAATDTDVTFDALIDQVTGGDPDPEKPFSVGGRDVDIEAMFERADDFLRDLTERSDR